MMKKIIVVFLFSCFFGSIGYSQGCTTLGQTPATAFPVCGTATFEQTSVPLCDNGSLTVPGCDDNVPYSDKNPFWYRFTCFAGGQLSFTITPNNQGDDYDWQMYDITGHDPNDIYTNPGLVVTGNWAATPGNTGARTGGSAVIQCASDPRENKPTFSSAPTLIVGHTYLLMVSHYTDTQTGYKLSFGGTANITDPVDPAIKSVSPNCDGTQLRVKLNKKMKCNTLAADGSDFYIPRNAAKIISATGIGCSSSFDFDSLVITLDQPIYAGNYVLKARKDNSGNYLLDNCDRNLPENDSIPFTIYTLAPIPLGDLTPVTCAPQMLQFTFEKNIQCKTIDADGSCFLITGPHPVKIASASGICTSGLSRVVNVFLQSPVVLDGTYTIQLVTGNDGNTVIDECDEEVVAGATKDFTVKDTVSADFTYNLMQECNFDQVNFYNSGGTSITNWYWTIDADASTQQNPVEYYTRFGTSNVQLIVTNGFCSDTTTQSISIPHDVLTAAINGPDISCPDDVTLFTDASVGNIVAWNWKFGNGNTSAVQNPPPFQYGLNPNVKEQLYTVELIVESNRNCFDTTTKIVKVVNNCHIAVPSAFTPNGDGINDYLYPLNAYKATGLQFYVYNQYGQLIYQTRDWTQKWDGTFKGNPQPTGVYVWMLNYTDDKGQHVFKKGTTVLIR